MSRPAFVRFEEPKSGERITKKDSELIVPDHPVIPFIEGDGTGPDIWKAAFFVFNKAVQKAYGSKRKIHWYEIFAGEKAYKMFNEWSPEDVYEAIKYYRVGIKGPLTTPIGGGIRSLNVTLRQRLDLYACVRPCKYYTGTPSPVIHPEKVNMVIFRENTEDVYSGIEWPAESSEANRIIDILKSEFGINNIKEDSGIGIKPISKIASQRIMKMAIDYAIKNQKPSITIVHKGNIMKYTEGAFKSWCYELAQNEYADKVITETEVTESFGGKAPEGKILIKDRITDSMFQQVLLRPDEYSVIVTTNLNGDYLSDAIAAQVGGLGIGPGANMNDDYAVFEATHGTAPKYAGLNKVNPGSLILSGAMMFEHLGWMEVKELIEKGLGKAIRNKTVTYDFARQMTGATEVSCSGFAEKIVDNF